MPNHLISVSSAAAMTTSFRFQKENILATNMQNAGTLPVCETFDRSAFDIILGDSNCTSIRIYMGIDGHSKVRLIITGVNSRDEDIVIPSSHPANSLGVDCVVEDGVRCPTSCPPPSSLNS